nr:MAG TPA: distal tail protein [Caudoviricetes sp.]
MTLKVTCSLMKESMQDIADVRRMLAEVLYTQEPKKLLLPDERGTYYYALYAGGATPQELVKYPTVELEFLVPDPIAYGGHHEERVQTHKDGTTEDVMLVGGTYPIKPKITIACEPNFYPMEIANKTTGKKICFVEDFKSNQVVTIDCELERVSVSTVAPNPNGGDVLKANTRDIPLFLESDFFDIKDNDILYHSPSIDAYTIEWDERFL